MEFDRPCAPAGICYGLGCRICACPDGGQAGILAVGQAADVPAGRARVNFDSPMLAFKSDLRIAMRAWRAACGVLAAAAGMLAMSQAVAQSEAALRPTPWPPGSPPVRPAMANRAAPARRLLSAPGGQAAGLSVPPVAEFSRCPAPVSAHGASAQRPARCVSARDGGILRRPGRALSAAGARRSLGRPGRARPLAGARGRPGPRYPFLCVLPWRIAGRRRAGHPGLLGLPRDYLVAQIGSWQNGLRRAAEPDCMAQVSLKLTPEDIGAVSAWLASRWDIRTRRNRPAR